MIKPQNIFQIKKILDLFYTQRVHFSHLLFEMAAMPFPCNGLFLCCVNIPREGVIIEWPLNGQFHNAVTDILTSQTNVRAVRR